MEIEDILMEVMVEFGRHIESRFDEGAHAKLREVFEKTLGKRFRGKEGDWKEPIRSYALRHYGKIGRLTEARARNGLITDNDIHEAADDVIQRARRACKSRPDLMKAAGPLCVGWDY